MKHRIFLAAAAFSVLFAIATGCVGGRQSKTDAPATREITRAVLLDRIYGGWVGMLIGGLEGLPHEFKYNEQPRATLPDFTFLKNGAVTDDDNDFEWTHLWFMDQEGVIKLPYPRLVEIWKANMNSGIWVANEQARKLMDQGVVPPETGSVARNPHAWYNLSGQFCVESYGLIAPGMPQTAADIGLHYAHIAVSEEPLQATQFWTSLVALRMFPEGSLDDALQQALAGVDPKSCMAEVVADARQAFHAHPDDWKAARQEIHEKWLKQRNWNGNSTPLNGAAICLALLYGNDDFYRTLQYAMALGYDADCNAATAGTVVGARLGFKRIAALPQFQMPDRYVNKTRPQLPAESKISEQAETLLRVAERVILANGGERITIDGQPGYRIKLQSPRVLERLPENPHGPQKQPAPVALVAATPPPAPAKPAEVVPVGSVIRIDAGSDANFTDAAGNIWLSDRGFEGGEASVREDDMKIGNTKDAGIYRSEHWGMSSFSQTLSNGKYVVKLHFAETWDGVTGPEGRVFSMNVEGQEFKDFDVWVKAGGGQRAYVETVNVTIADGKLDITFENKLDNPEINGIEIIPVP